MGDIINAGGHYGGHYYCWGVLCTLRALQGLGSLFKRKKPFLTAVNNRCKTGIKNGQTDKKWMHKWLENGHEKLTVCLKPHLHIRA